MFNIGKKANLINEVNKLDIKSVNNIRGLSLDMIQNAKSGHPGICLGAASIIYTLFKKHININLDNLDFVNRDRFILSAGHGAPLLYSCLHLLNLLSLDDLKSLRKLNSKTPGHPEYLKTPLVEMTTGPLGQGVATGVGMALSEAYLNCKTSGVIDYRTYVLCSDGDLQEGVSYEALALAGTLKLNNLILLYDSNNTTLDNKLEVSSSEDIKKRFESIHFQVLETSDDVSSIDNCLNLAKKSAWPTIIIVKTTIGAYSKNAGKNITHGKILDDDDVLSIKEKLNLHKTPFTISHEVVESFYSEVEKRGKTCYQEFQKKLAKLEDKTFIEKIINHDNTYMLDEFEVGECKSLRDLSGDILNYIAKNNDLVIGGSADLSSSCKTNLESDTFSSSNYLGRNIYFGVREHAMSCILNGMALSGLRPFGSTFLTFSDYMRPGIRMSAMMNLPVLYILTHDSILVGEDGTTHHPIEQLASLELIPNLKVYRPFDLNELIGSYQEIMKNQYPSALILPRSNERISNMTKTSGVKDGMYYVRDSEDENCIYLLSQGEELGLTLDVATSLLEKGISSKVISVPCFKNIKETDKNKLKNKTCIAITLGSPHYFYSLTNLVIGINTFSESGSKEELLEHFGYTKELLESKILALLESLKD